jgi:hypothetical protein
MRYSLASVLILSLIGFAVGCSSGRPWKVPPERERRFLEAEKACKKLTDDTPAFEKCLKRRGFRREYPGGF